MDGNALINERNTLIALDGTCAPKLLEIRGNVLETEYVGGRLLVDEYLAADENGAAVLAERLAGTVRTLYGALGRITFDENFRNYIVNGEKIIRVDFEKPRRELLRNGVRSFSPSLCSTTREKE